MIQMMVMIMTMWISKLSFSFLVSIFINNDDGDEEHDDNDDEGEDDEGEDDEGEDDDDL